MPTQSNIHRPQRASQMVQTRAPVRRALLAGAIASLLACVMLVASGDAFALSGTPMKVGEPFTNEQPAVAVDATGTADIVWANTRLAKNTVEYCVLPIGASGCSHSGALTPAGGSEPHIDRVQVLAVGGTIVVLADVYGVSEEHAPEQEWQSTDGGATFAVVNSGKSVADGTLSADATPLNSVVVPGTGALGYGWDEISLTSGFGDTPTFDEFPLNSPSTCTPASGTDYPPNCPANEFFAALEPEELAVDQIGNANGAIASRLVSDPGVLGVFETDFNNPPLCAHQFGMAYAYGSGDQSATNSYDISPGKTHSAWKVSVSQGDCNVSNPAAGGGASGLGVVENDLADGFTVYHAFDQEHEDFDTPMVPIASQQERDASVSQDGTGVIYTTYLGPDGSIRLAASTTGGVSWTGPATLYPDPSGEAANVTSSVSVSGQGWVVWTQSGEVLAQPFDEADAVPPAPSPPHESTPPPPPAPGTAVLKIPKQTDDVTSAGDFSVDVKCEVARCSGNLTIFIKGKRTITIRKHHKKHKVTITVTHTLDSVPFTALAVGSHTIAMHLDKHARKLLEEHHYRLDATGSATYLSGGAFKSTTGSVTLEGHKPKKHHHHH